MCLVCMKISMQLIGCKKECHIVEEVNEGDELEYVKVNVFAAPEK